MRMPTEDVNDEDRELVAARKVAARDLVPLAFSWPARQDTEPADTPSPSKP